MASAEVEINDELSDIKIEYENLRSQLCKLENLLCKENGGELGLSARLQLQSTKLFNTEQFSDVQVILKGGSHIKAHKMILAASGNDWGVEQFDHVDMLDLTDLRYEVGYALMQWVYTDDFGGYSDYLDDNFFIEMMQAAKVCKLKSLHIRCQKALATMVNNETCDKYLKLSEEFDAKILKDNCEKVLAKKRVIELPPKENQLEQQVTKDMQQLQNMLTQRFVGSENSRTIAETDTSRITRVLRNGKVHTLTENELTIAKKTNEISQTLNAPIDIQTGATTHAKNTDNMTDSVKNTRPQIVLEPSKMVTRSKSEVILGTSSPEKMLTRSTAKMSPNSKSFNSLKSQTQSKEKTVATKEIEKRKNSNIDQTHINVKRKSPKFDSRSPETRAATKQNKSKGSPEINSDTLPCKRSLSKTINETDLTNTPKKAKTLIGTTLKSLINKDAVKALDHGDDIEHFDTDDDTNDYIPQNDQPNQQEHELKGNINSVRKNNSALCESESVISMKNSSSQNPQANREKGSGEKPQPNSELEIPQNPLEDFVNIVLEPRHIKIPDDARLQTKAHSDSKLVGNDKFLEEASQKFNFIPQHVSNNLFSNVQRLSNPDVFKINSNIHSQPKFVDGNFQYQEKNTQKLGPNNPHVLNLNNLAPNIEFIDVLTGDIIPIKTGDLKSVKIDISTVSKIPLRTDVLPGDIIPIKAVNVNPVKTDVSTVSKVSTSVVPDAVAVSTPQNSPSSYTSPLRPDVSAGDLIPIKTGDVNSVKTVSTVRKIPTNVVPHTVTVSSLPQNPSLPSNIIPLRTDVSAGDLIPIKTGDVNTVKTDISTVSKVPASVVPNAVAVSSPRNPPSNYTIPLRPDVLAGDIIQARTDISSGIKDPINVVPKAATVFTQTILHQTPKQFSGTKISKENCQLDKGYSKNAAHNSGSAILKTTNPTKDFENPKATTPSSTDKTEKQNDTQIEIASSTNDLLNELNKEHKVSTFYQCITCDWIFSDLQLLMDHMKSHRKNLKSLKKPKVDKNSKSKLRHTITGNSTFKKPKSVKNSKLRDPTTENSTSGKPCVDKNSKLGDTIVHSTYVKPRVDQKSVEQDNKFAKYVRQGYRKSYECKYCQKICYGHSNFALHYQDHVVDIINGTNSTTTEKPSQSLVKYTDTSEAASSNGVSSETTSYEHSQSGENKTATSKTNSTSEIPQDTLEEVVKAAKNFEKSQSLVKNTDTSKATFSNGVSSEKTTSEELLQSQQKNTVTEATFASDADQCKLTLEEVKASKNFEKFRSEAKDMETYKATSSKELAQDAPEVRAAESFEKSQPGVDSTCSDDVNEVTEFTQRNAQPLPETSEVNTEENIMNGENEKTAVNTTRKSKSVLGPYKCKLCERFIKESKEFFNHLNIHLKNSGHAAEITDVQYGSDYKSQIIQCEVCGKSVKGIRNLKSHQKLHFKTYNCKICGETFTDYQKLRLHTIKCKHNEVETFQCDICDHSFTTSKYKGPALLEKHKSREHEVKAYQCHICGSKSSSNMSLKSHLRNIHELEKKFECQICHKKFPTKTILNVHASFHRKDWKNKCSICGKLYKLESQLTVHMRSHTGEKPYKCKYCGKGFIKKCYVRSHEETHSDSYPFICNICGHGNKTRISHKAHVYKHKKPKPARIPCNYCEKDFSCRGNIRQHMRRFHKEYVNPYETNHQTYTCSSTLPAIDEVTIQTSEVNDAIPLELENAVDFLEYHDYL